MTAPERATRTGRLNWAVWTVLVAATLLSLTLSAEFGDPRLKVVAVVVVAAFKVGLIMWRFMEVGRCGRAVQLAFLSWPVVLVAIVLGVYFTEIA